MTEVRLHRAIYAKAAVDEAIATFSPYATLTVEERGEQLVVHVTASTPAKTRRVAGEFGNFALGATVRDRGAR